jgi:transcriptional regulator with XRE-family HTH domain
MGFAERLRALMAERDLSGLAVARKVHCDQAYISRLASGKQPPSRKIARLLDDALDAGGELAGMADHDRAASRGAQEPSGDLLALAWLVGKLDRRVSRSTAQGFAATLADSRDAGMADPASRLAHALANRTGLTGETVSYLETRSLGFHWLECVLPGSHLFQAVLTHLSEVVSVLEACGQDRQRQRLAVTAGETALLAAWMAWDLGDMGHSAALYRAAGLAAREAGDHALTACAVIYQSQSVGASGIRAHAHARRRLADAREHLLPGPGDPATRAWLLAREAEAASAAGDPAAAGMIKAASDALTAAQPQRERSWTRCLDSPQLTHARLIIATRLRDEALLEGAINDLLLLAAGAEQKKSGRMLASIGLALTAIGDVSEGVRFGWRSVEAVRQSRARYALDRLSELAAALEVFDGARGLREEIHATRRELVSRHPSTRGSLPALS